MRITQTLTSLSVIIVLASSAKAQTTGSLSLPILVDGKIHPELISDELAYQHFVTSLAIRSDASADDIKRRDSQLRRLKLSTADQAAIVEALNGVREQLDYLEEERRSSDPASPALEQTLASINQQREARLLAAKNSLSLKVTPEGMVLIDAFIRSHVKTHITIYGMDHSH